ncbi:MAG: response regulator transcription factor [Lachnospiraceae bacterium]|nr:response regulator transcription factor [Lachnospiraceae bacterium]
MILIIEDDMELHTMVKDYLISEGFETESAFNGQEACELADKKQYELVLLDIMMPQMDGLTVMKKIRTNSVVPIIIMSAKDSDSDKAFGLGLGADDYITKPFSLTELVARIKAHIRRANQYSAGENEKKRGNISIGDLVLNQEMHSLEKRGQYIELTAKEFEALKLFMTNPKKVYTKAQLYTLVWGEDYFGDENAVNVLISRLRSKLEDNPKKPQYIATVWGIGYKLGI